VLALEVNSLLPVRSMALPQSAFTRMISEATKYLDSHLRGNNG